MEEFKRCVDVALRDLVQWRTQQCRISGWIDDLNVIFQTILFYRKILGKTDELANILCNSGFRYLDHEIEKPIFSI